ncbi:MAG: photosystem reaction center subunit H [Burkholderiales bacterium PBB6]|nr:MAG: photosystem reaction center subunit H [Burkholderiales bacterium PBB6]
MLRNLQDLDDFKISATDGEIGHVKDFYFEDNTWAVRYLVVEAGSWANSRKVLISPISVRHPDWLARTLSVSISQQQVKNSPSFDTDKPVSRQNEEQYLGYYGYPTYWGGAGLWGEGFYPYAMVPGYLPGDAAGYGLGRADRDTREQEMAAYLRDQRARHRHDDPHLRSVNAVTGYHIHATDGDIGHVSGFLVDDETWAIRYLVIDTSNWWMGHKVLIAPPWIKGVHWTDQTVAVDLNRESIKNAPHYDPDSDWGRDQEQALARHYGRSGWWAGSTVSETGL